MAHAVNLTWVAPVGGGTVVSYDVQRAPIVQGVIGQFASIANPEPASTAYTDNGPFVEGQQYEYQVRSVNSAGESAPCPEFTVTIPFSVPNAPTGLVGTAT